MFTQSSGVRKYTEMDVPTVGFAFQGVVATFGGENLLLDLLCVSDVYRSTFGFRAGNGSVSLNNESTKGNEDWSSSTNTKNFPRHVNKPPGFLFPSPASV